MYLCASSLLIIVNLIFGSLILTSFPLIFQVGYRSLRGSHSISDLSLAGNLDGSRSGLSAANRYAKTGKLELQRGFKDRNLFA